MSIVSVRGANPDAKPDANPDGMTSTSTSPVAQTTQLTERQWRRVLLTDESSFVPHRSDGRTGVDVTVASRHVFLKAIALEVVAL